MRKGEQTRQMILERAAPVFNTMGFSGTSISDLVNATGLEKGGIYNHFANKEQLALEAFDYALEKVKERFGEAVTSKRHAIDRLIVVMEAFASIIDNPPVAGGCPVLNTAIEADDTHPALRERAQAGMNEFQGMIIRITQKGIERGEIRPDVNPNALASLLTASMEGAVMLSKLYGDMSHMQRVIEHLTAHVKTLAPQ